MIPRTYDEWKNCIINDCKIDLTYDFVQKRLSIYQDRNHKETIKFIELYGEPHYQNIKNWLLLTIKNYND